MILSFFSSRGWESWDIASRPLIPERMPVLVDDDLLFGDGPGAPRPAAAVNQWLRELPASACPASSSWESYARVVREWAEFLDEHGVGLFDSRERLKAALGKYAEYRAAGPAERRFAATTWGRHMSVLSLFYRWAMEERHASIESRLYGDAERHLAEPFRLREQDGDVVGRARLHLDTARMRGRQGRHHDAHSHGRQALELFRAAGVLAGEADALNEIGWHQCPLGDYTAGIASCKQALQVYQQTGNRHQQGFTWDTLGYAHMQLGHRAEATACYRHAVQILSELGHKYNTADTLIHASDAYQAVGETAAARDALTQALVLLNDLHHLDAAGARRRLTRL